MVKDTKVVAYTTTIAMIVSVLAVLIGSGIGWGILQTRVSSLEARADVITTGVEQFRMVKIDKEVYYKDMEGIHQSLRVISEDVKIILRRPQNQSSIK